MTRPAVVIYVSGGCVQDVESPVDYVVVDYDNIEAGDPMPTCSHDVPLDERCPQCADEQNQ